MNHKLLASIGACRPPSMLKILMVNKTLICCNPPADQIGQLSEKLMKLQEYQIGAIAQAAATGAIVMSNDGTKLVISGME